MNYDECLLYLEKAARFGIKLGLENIHLLLDELNSPQNAFPSVLVAGTNGKGSVCAMIHSALVRHGLKIGLYTSPHLVRVEERIRINHQLISPMAFCELLNFLKKKIEGLIESKKLGYPPTYFEILTALAFLYFAQEKVDLAVLEVGLGGRLDATNVVTPLVSVITSISRDHMEHLGNTIKKIAAEKAGIIKPGVPVVCGRLQPAAMEVMASRAAEIRSPLIKVFSQGRLIKKSAPDSLYAFYFQGEKYQFRPGLQGEHQAWNAATAITVLHLLNERWRPLNKDKIIEGLEKVVWEGRLEKISDQPEVYLDGAHNEEGAKVLRRFLEEKKPSRLILVFGILKDKEIRRLARQLFPLATRVVVTSINCSRAASPEDVVSFTQDLNPQIEVVPDCLEALKLAKKEAGKQGLVLVTGSLYLIGEIKKRLLESSIE
ncbi:MAG: bifunctional folylpolyglutamate synthase/dihydrofolate synthase [Candidatus Aminicenantes bacterium]|nr:bifunctional folylpolyglutamate synthase/dihydrofolate synthase [Candidatus Aminicenantes bacterium]